MLSLAALASPAFAQQTADGTTSVSAPSASASNQDSGVGGVAAGASQGQAGAVSGELTRAEVKQQLVEAERDGELARLNSTLYRGQ
ncbi:hypothetical protein D0B32_22870 [Paraburkholderia sp. DHOC27]|nr:hypothetical protein D0B32_22870 [Paraburkholderia sp. DHOC27]